MTGGCALNNIVNNKKTFDSTPVRKVYIQFTANDAGGEGIVYYIYFIIKLLAILGILLGIRHSRDPNLVKMKLIKELKVKS